jgi:hypothetical protein
LGADAICIDGVCDQIKCVVFDPVAQGVTHLVVEAKHREGLGRLVPLDLVEAHQSLGIVGDGRAAGITGLCQSGVGWAYTDLDVPSGQPEVMTGRGGVAPLRDPLASLVISPGQAPPLGVQGAPARGPLRSWSHLSRCWRTRFGTIRRTQRLIL